MADETGLRRSATRLIPLLVLIYALGWLDRVNVGFAALTMNADLGFSPSAYGFGAGIFFFGYFVFQVPSTIALTRLGAKRWIAGTMLIWGALSAAQALVTGTASFYVLRFLLGVAEAGIFPGIVFYLTQWFPQAWRARVTAGFMTAIPLANILGAPLSGFLLGLSPAGGLRGWQWLFVIEGVPACVLAVVVLLFLPAGPDEARWLTADEKQAMQVRLAAEAVRPGEASWSALYQPAVIGLALVGFALGFGGYGISLWLPQILQSLGYSNAGTGLMVAGLAFIGLIAMILWGFSSDSRGERIRHIAIALMLAAAGLVAAGLAGTLSVAILALGCVVVGVLAADGPFFSLPSSFLAEDAAAGAVALINAVGSLGAFSGPVLIGVLRQQSGGYALGMDVLAAALALAAGALFALGRTDAGPAKRGAQRLKL
jgi:ACS family tartrate transporter-like MFS transporter